MFGAIAPTYNALNPMTPNEFDALASAGYNRIPLVRELLADLDTPLSTYLKLGAGRYSYLFESVQGGEKWGRYSIIGLSSRRVLRTRGAAIEVSHDGEVVESVEHPNPLEWLREYLNNFRAAPVPGLPRFTGGLVGYFGYDTVRYVETRLGECPNEDELGVPDILLMESEELLVFDNLRARVFIIVHADPATQGAYAKASQRLSDIQAQLESPTVPVPASWPGQVVGETDFVSGYGHEAFLHDVERCKRYIVDGDAMQIVLSQRLQAPFDASPIALYRALRALNPSPYMFYLDLEDFQVVGSSPEILTRVEDGKITVRPLAGTRPRGKTVAEDEALERELLADPKELAEHLMLIDLGRNDVGRVAKIGSVKVTEQMAIERYSHVMHIVSNVEGELLDDITGFDALAASFPAGTLSGAPKVRAMEILDELEPVKRCVYSGAVGYVGYNGVMDTAIAIRTAVVKDGKVTVQAGAGIVADSNPESEWQETLSKCRAIFRAVEHATRGLDSTSGASQ